MPHCLRISGNFFLVFSIDLIYHRSLCSLFVKLLTISQISKLFKVSFNFLICQDQRHIDSLETMPERNKLGDDELTGVLLELTKAYGYNAPKKRIEYGLAALDLSRKTGNQINEALALRSIGVSNHFLDRCDIAKEYYDSILIISVEAGYKEPVFIILEASTNTWAITTVRWSIT